MFLIDFILFWKVVERVSLECWRNSRTRLCVVCCLQGYFYCTTCPLLFLFFFLDAFEKFRKAIMSFVISVRPSVRMEQLGSHWKDFDEIWYVNFFRMSIKSKFY